MLYTYECKKHGEVDLILPLSEWDKQQVCPKCNKPMKKILVPGHGGIQTDNDVPWLPGALEGLQDTDNIRAGLEKPIETRTEYKNFLKEKGYVPVNG